MQEEVKNNNYGPLSGLFRSCGCGCGNNDSTILFFLIVFLLLLWIMWKT